MRARDQGQGKDWAVEALRTISALVRVNRTLRQKAHVGLYRGGRPGHPPDARGDAPPAPASDGVPGRRFGLVITFRSIAPRAPGAAVRVQLAMHEGHVGLVMSPS